MDNNKLIPYKENIFSKILKFFKQIISRKKLYSAENMTQETIESENNKVNFWENIQIKEDEEQIRLKILQTQYDNGQIDEEDISDEDMDKLIEMYEKETEQLNRDTENIKFHISQMLKEIKKF